MNRIWILVMMGVVACSAPKKPIEAPQGNSSVQLQYAQKFRLEPDKVVVTEPWPGATQPIEYRINGKKGRIVVTSTTHLPYLEMLGLEDRLVGFPSTQYISSDIFRKRVQNGQITDLGPDGNINLELLISVKPDVVIAFDMGSEATGLDKVKESGIPVIYNADFLEPTTLGRAEWIKFFGAYFGKQQLADSIFSAISIRYDSLKQLAQSATSKPTVISGIMYGDVWFMPGGQNYGARFFEDAGGIYLWNSDTNTGWIEASFEAVFDKGSQAEFWIGLGSFGTLNELASEDQRYAEFRPFKSQQVYNYSKRRSRSGGFDFFESGYARPDIVLADLIKILHPELLPDYDMYYYEKLP